MVPPPAEPRPTWLPSLAVIFFVLALVYGFFAPVYSGDVGWQIRAGQTFLDHGDVPRVNLLSFTAPLHTWVAHEWASGVLYAGVDRFDGVAGLLLLRGLFFGAMIAAPYLLGRALGACPLGLVLWMIPAGTLLALHTALRPWHLSNILLVLTLYLCHRVGREARLLWILPVLLGLWAPFHGGYVWGGAVVGAYGLQWLKDGPARGGPGRVALIGAGLLTLVFLLLGPYGTEALVFPFRYISRDPHSGIGLMYQEVKEWAPPDLTSLFGILFLGDALLALLGLLRLKRDRLALWVIHVAFFYMAVRVQRHIPLFVIVSAVPISLGLLAPLRRWAARRAAGWGARWAGMASVEGAPRRGLVALGVALVFAVALIASRDPAFATDRLHAHGYPTAGAAALRARGGGNLLNHYDWGGYLPWQAPGWAAFITPVPDAFPAKVFEDWFALANLTPGWEQVLDAYDIDAVAFPPSSALVQTLARDPAWRILHEDAYALILVRATAGEGPHPPEAPAPAAPRSGG